MKRKVLVAAVALTFSTGVAHATIITGETLWTAKVRGVNTGSTADIFWDRGDTISIWVTVAPNAAPGSLFSDGPNGIAEYGQGDDVWEYDFPNFPDYHTVKNVGVRFDNMLTDYLHLVQSPDAPAPLEFCNITVAYWNSFTDLTGMVRDEIRIIGDGIGFSLGNGYTGGCCDDCNDLGYITTPASGLQSGEIDFFAVNFTPTPEPDTMLLFGTGLAGLACSRLRRKKK